MSNRRKTLIINAVQQRRLIMGSVLVTIILINSLALFALFLRPPLLLVVETEQTLALAGLEIVIVAVIGYYSLILSHKIAGPAYAIARDLKRLADGDLTVRTHLRKGDFHTEVAEAFNLAGQTLCSRIKTIEALLITLQQRASADETMRHALNEVLQQLRYFNTDPPPFTEQGQDTAPFGEPRETVAMAGINKHRTGR